MSKEFSMSTPLLWIITTMYAVVAVDLVIKREWMGLTFAGYAMANIGIILSLPK